MPSEVLGFLDYIRERQAATDRRRSGQPPPWSAGPVIANKKLCSVVRDDDRTSVEAKAYILGLPPDDGLRAALGFRLLNRVSSIRVVIESGARKKADIRAALDTKGPIFNTAYRIVVPGGWWNLDGLALYMLRLWYDAEFMRQPTARGTVERIRAAGPGLFLAYQIMQDLRWLYGPYPDEGTWAYVGPGAMRGLERLEGTYRPMSSTDRRRLSQGMKGTAMPPRITQTMSAIRVEAREVFPGLNLFEIEHNLCEWDRYCRIATGETRGAAFKPLMLDGAQMLTVLEDTLEMMEEAV